jgi:hypothetical protein
VKCDVYNGIRIDTIQVYRCFSKYMGKEAGRLYASPGITEIFEGMRRAYMHDNIWEVMVPKPCKRLGGVEATMPRAQRHKCCYHDLHIHSLFSKIG